MAKKAVLIGVNRYRVPGADLRGCVNDVKNMTAVLKANGFKPGDITTLVDFANLNSSTLAIDTTGFANAFTGSFGVSTVGSTVLLSYTPAAVPEPSTWALLLTGLAALFWYARRRR